MFGCLSKEEKKILNKLANEDYKTQLADVKDAWAKCGVTVWSGDSRNFTYVCVGSSKDIPIKDLGSDTIRAALEKIPRFYFTDKIENLKSELQSRYEKTNLFEQEINRLKALLIERAKKKAKRK